jgi:hypothetical protein
VHTHREDGFLALLHVAVEFEASGGHFEFECLFVL